MAKKKEKKAGKRMKKSEMSERLISLYHTKTELTKETTNNKKNK